MNVDPKTVLRDLKESLARDPETIGRRIIEALAHAEEDFKQIREAGLLGVKG